MAESALEEADSVRIEMSHQFRVFFTAAVYWRRAMAAGDSLNVRMSQFQMIDEILAKNACKLAVFKRTLISRQFRNCQHWNVALLTSTCNLFAFQNLRTRLVRVRDADVYVHDFVGPGTEEAR